MRGHCQLLRALQLPDILTVYRIIPSSHFNTRYILFNPVFAFSTPFDPSNTGVLL